MKKPVHILVLEWVLFVTLIVALVWAARSEMTSDARAEKFCAFECKKLGLVVNGINKRKQLCGCSSEIVHIPIGEPLEEP